MSAPFSSRGKSTRIFVKEKKISGSVKYRNLLFPSELNSRS